jgi:hypothetical protein
MKGETAVITIAVAGNTVTMDTMTTAIVDADIESRRGS